MLLENVDRVALLSSIWTPVVPIHHLFSSIYHHLKPQFSSFKLGFYPGNETLQCFAFEEVDKLGQELPPFALNPSK